MFCLDERVFFVFGQAEAGSVAGDGPEYPLSSVLRKNKGTLSVVAEYRKILKSGKPLVFYILLLFFCPMYLVFIYFYIYFNPPTNPW